MASSPGFRSRKLIFTPYAYAKLVYLRDKGDTEVTGFGLGHPDNPLFITDFELVKAECSSSFVDMDMDWVLEHWYGAKLGAGYSIDQCFRVWIHTHPGDSATPSQTDEDTFDESFADMPWAVMAILARGGQFTARLRTKPTSKISADAQMATAVDWAQPFEASDHVAWDAEYHERVTRRTYTSTPAGYLGYTPRRTGRWNYETRRMEYDDEDKDDAYDPADPFGYLREAEKEYAPKGQAKKVKAQTKNTDLEFIAPACPEGEEPTYANGLEMGELAGAHMFNQYWTDAGKQFDWWETPIIEYQEDDEYQTGYADGFIRGWEIAASDAQVTD